MISSFAHFIIKQAKLIALIGIITGGVGAFYSVKLFKNLRTNIEEMLPTNARSVIDLDEVTRRLESIDNLVVLVLSENAKESQRFVDDLVGELNKAPKTVVASVEYRISKELEFFKARQTLFLELHDLEEIRNYIRNRLEFEKKIRNPLSLLEGEEIPEPRFDFFGLRKKYSKQTSNYERFPDGYYATPDGKKRAVMIYLPGKASSIDQVHLLKKTVGDAIQKLNPASYAPDMKIHYTGGVQETLEEHEALIEDLLLSAIVVTVLVFVALLVFYKNFTATMVLLGSLFMGVFWTFGAAFHAIGYLNANTAFLGSIVIGNGINFGIIYLARYFEERRSGKNYLRAAHLAITQTVTSTLTASLAAGLSYGSLMLTGFRGFNQFGVIGLIGMVLCWISSYTLLPAFLVIVESWSPLVKKGVTPDKHYISHLIASFVSKFAKPIWILTFVATIASIGMFFKYDYSILETNFNNLRNKNSIISGAAHYAKIQDEIFQRYLTPLVVLPRDVAHVPEIKHRLQEEAKKEGATTMIASVSTLQDFIPKQQPEKIAVLKQIRNLLPQRLIEKLDPSDQRKIKELLRPEAFTPFYGKDMPKLVLQKFTERDGTIGKMILIEPPLDHSTLEGMRVRDFILKLRNTTDSVAPGTPIAGTLTITSDMLTSISNDGPKATLFAFVAVVLLILFLFRNFYTSALVLFSLVLGVIWMGGMILGFWYKINVLNFIALPITFGIGVDYGVNVFQRYRLDKKKNILSVLKNTGSAVILCSFTTIVGYGSLLIASNQGFVSFGRLAVIGELTCLIAAVISLPAYLALRERK